MFKIYVNICTYVCIYYPKNYLIYLYCQFSIFDLFYKCLHLKRVGERDRQRKRII